MYQGLTVGGAWGEPGWRLERVQLHFRVGAHAALIRASARQTQRPLMRCSNWRVFEAAVKLCGAQRSKPYFPELVRCSEPDGLHTAACLARSTLDNRMASRRQLSRGARSRDPAARFRDVTCAHQLSTLLLLMFRVSVRRATRGIRISAPPADFQAPFIPLVADGFSEAIGNTPLLRLPRISDSVGRNIYAKAEYMNPGGSIKDRAAKFILDDAERKGLIQPGGTVVEGTAGNTGIGLAHVCRLRGYNCIIYMPNTQSPSKIETLRLLGAEVHPVPAVAFDNPENYNHQAKRHAERLDNAVWTNQFDNVANRQAHIDTTGPEIWAQLNGKVDAWTCSTGTGGTFAGVTRYLKSMGDVRCVLADPPGSVLYSYIQSGGKEIVRGGSSFTEGIGQGRVTDNLAPELDVIDDAIQVSDEESIAMLYRLLAEEGVYVGGTSALNVVAACRVAATLPEGSNVVTVLCDSAHKYAAKTFSRKWLKEKKLWDAVPEDLRRFAVLE